MNELMTITATIKNRAKLSVCLNETQRHETTRNSEGTALSVLNFSIMQSRVDVCRTGWCV
jgi:hypothetical protein